MTVEIRCFEDMDQFGSETVDELENLAQDLYHRLIEDPGSNLDDPSRGMGLLNVLSAGVSDANPTGGSRSIDDCWHFRARIMCVSTAGSPTRHTSAKGSPWLMNL